MPVASADLAREITEAIAASQERDATVRVMLTGGAPPTPSLVPREAARATRIVLVEPLAPIPRAVYVEGSA